MAQNYKRHARGGSFKRDNIGDGGLSEYRRQQGEIIDSLKLQQARTDEYSKEYLSATKGVDQKEAENRQILQRLEDKIYQTKRGAIETAKRGEVDYWKGKEREYAKKADFWKDFSSTYAKQWGDLAQGVVDKVQMDQSRALIDDMYDAGLIQAYADQNKYLEKNGIFDPITRESSFVINDPTATPEEKSVRLNLLAGFAKRSNRFTGNMLAKELKKNSSGLSEFVKKNYIDEREHLTPELINEAHRKAREDFKSEWNIRPGSSSEAIDDVFNTAGLVAGKTLANNRTDSESIETSNNYIAQFQSIQANPDSIEEFNSQRSELWQLMINSHTGMVTKEHPKGMSKAAAIEYTASKVRESFGTFDEWISFIEQQGQVGALFNKKTNQYLPLFGERFKGDKGKILRDDWLERMRSIWTNAEVAERKSELKALDSKGLLDIQTLENKYFNENSDDYLDITNDNPEIALKHWNTAIGLLPNYRAHIGRPDASNPHLWLTNKLGLKPGSLNENSAEFLVAQGLAANDYNQVALLWSHLSPKHKELHVKQWERMQLLNKFGLTDKEITAWAKEIVKNDAGIDVLDKIQHPTASKMVDVVRSTFYNDWNNSSKVTKEDVIVLQNKIKADLNKNEGIYKNKPKKAGEPLQKEYILFTDTSDTYKKREMESINLWQKTSSGEFNIEEDIPKVISKHEADQIAYALIRDKSVEIPQSLRYLARYYDKDLSEVVNKALKGHEITQEVTPNFHELALKKRDSLNLGDKTSYGYKHESEQIKVIEFLFIQQQLGPTTKATTAPLEFIEVLASPNIKKVLTKWKETK